jgi:nucleoside-diphosphate-sugar epimerase
MSQTSQHHLVLGAGQIGTALAQSLLRAGHRVTMVSRKAPVSTDAAISHRAGSIADIAFAQTVASDADVIYHVMNPPYQLWRSELEPLTTGVLAAAAVNKAPLIVLDNLYMFGNMHGVPMAPGSAQQPCSVKGQLRKQMADRYMEAHHLGNAQVAIARASDFVGPGIIQAHLGERFFRRVLAGKKGECMGDPSIPHAFTYGPDVITALSALGATKAYAGRAWHIPTLPAQSVTAWGQAFGRVLGKDAGVVKLPSAVLTMLGLFVPAMRELKEMRYQWESPYLVDDSETRAILKLQPTPFAQQIEATAAWAKRSFAPPA